MTNKHNDAVGNPYDWVDMGYEIKSQSLDTKTRQLPADYVIHDAGHPDFKDAQAEYWATHHKKGFWAEVDKLDIDLDVTPGDIGFGMAPMKGEGGMFVYDPGYDRAADATWERLHNPWVNGGYALAALVLGLIFMLVFSYWVGGGA